MEILVAAAIIIVLLIIGSVLAKKKRQKDFSKKFSILEGLVGEDKHAEALKMLEKVPVLKWRYKLEPEQRKKIIVLEIECLEKSNKISEAVISLAGHLSAAYKINEWPSALLSKWIQLYQSCEPIDIKKFYFCPSCGLHPETEALLKHAIEKEGCNPPINYPGKKGSNIIIEWGRKKFKKHT